MDMDNWIKTNSTVPKGHTHTLMLFLILKLHVSSNSTGSEQGHEF